MKTYPPELDPAVLDRLRDYAAAFADDFPQAKPAAWAGVYLEGLLLDGDRKSVEPLSRRVTLPPGLASKDPEQALQQFVNQSPWDERAVLRRYRATLARAFAGPAGCVLIDDVSFPKQGKHSVGVQRQYCGALGKKANCQVAVSVHYVGPKGHFPLGLPALFARRLAGRRRPPGPGRGPGGRAAAADQAGDRPGTARPGPGRGAARVRGRGRRRVRRLP